MSSFSKLSSRASSLSSREDEISIVIVSASSLSHSSSNRRVEPRNLRLGNESLAVQDTIVTCPLGSSREASAAPMTAFLTSSEQSIASTNAVSPIVVTGRGGELLFELDLANFPLFVFFTLFPVGNKDLLLLVFPVLDLGLFSA